MELLRKHVAVQPTRYAAYVALQVALMRRFLARGGTLEDYCARLAPAFQQRFGPSLALEPGASPQHCVLAPCSTRLGQECQRLRSEQTRPARDGAGSAEAA